MPQAEVLIHQAYEALVRQKAQLERTLNEVNARLIALRPLVRESAAPRPGVAGRKPRAFEQAVTAIAAVFEVEAGGMATRAELSAAANTSEKTFTRALDSLMREGWVVRVAHGLYQRGDVLDPDPEPPPFVPAFEDEQVIFADGHPRVPAATEGDGSPERPFQINPGV